MDEVLHRTFTAELIEEKDGRTLFGRCVPYDTVAKVYDPGAPALPKRHSPSAPSGAP